MTIALGYITGTSGKNLLLKEDPNFTPKQLTARVQRTATLDGGVVVDHMGVSNGDLTFDITAQITEAQESILWDMFTTQTYITVSVATGFYLGVIDQMNINRGTARLTILVAE
jgi:hypothetical protein